MLWQTMKTQMKLAAFKGLHHLLRQKQPPGAKNKLDNEIFTYMTLRI